MNAVTLPVPLDIRLMNLTATILLLAVLVGALAAGGGWLLRSPAFAVGRIVVEGDLAHVSAAGLRASVAPQMAGNFFTLDLDAVRRAFERTPWVWHAYVHREFPNTVRVRLQEHDAAAHWGAPGSAELVDSQGQVFNAGAGHPKQDGLPRLAGDAAHAAEMLSMYQRLAPALAPLQSNIDTLERTGQGGWRVTLDNGATLELGSGEQAALLERVRRLADTLPRVAQAHGRGVDALEYADLRHAGGYALRLRGVTTVGGGAAPARARARSNN
jgi:cell division protein FtsQ